MRFSALFLAISAVSAVSPASANYAVAGLKARSSKALLHLLVRSLDDEEAHAVLARYNELELQERDEDSSVSLQKRDYYCPRCPASFVLLREYQEHIAGHNAGDYAKESYAKHKGHGGNGDAPKKQVKTKGTKGHGGKGGAPKKPVTKPTKAHKGRP